MAQDTHEMVLSEMHSGGEEEWLCPACGRRLIVAVSPSLTNPGIAIYVMAEGEPQIAHTFAHENPQPKQADAAQTAQANELDVARVQSLTEEEQQRLQPFIEWLETVDLGI